MRPVPPLLALVAASLALTGCADRELNSRPVLSGTVTIPSLEPAPPESSLPKFPGPRLTRIDRADLAPITYTAPFDGVTHEPIWISYTLRSTTQARGAGLMPTTKTALELPSDEGYGAVTATLWAHTVAFFDIAVLPIRAIIDPATQRDVSPDIIYKRTQPGAWSAGVAPTPDEDPDA